jgi:hypothetical protein
MAVAHTMLVIAFHMLKTGLTNHELGGTYLEQINKDRLQRYFVKRLQRLGLKVTVEPVNPTSLKLILEGGDICPTRRSRQSKPLDKVSYLALQVGSI